MRALKFKVSSKGLRYLENLYLISIFFEDLALTSRDIYYRSNPTSEERVAIVYDVNNLDHKISFYRALKHVLDPYDVSIPSYKKWNIIRCTYKSNNFKHKHEYMKVEILMKGGISIDIGEMYLKAKEEENLRRYFFKGVLYRNGEKLMFSLSELNEALCILDLFTTYAEINEENKSLLLYNNHIPVYSQTSKDVQLIGIHHIFIGYDVVENVLLGMQHFITMKPEKYLLDAYKESIRKDVHGVLKEIIKDSRFKNVFIDSSSAYH